MDNGTLLENVPERYLETALPKAGGRVIILKGPLRLSLGKLLERNTDCDRGVIQLDVDLSVKKLPLDDIAEYCGSYD
jgi:G patch domain/KOW motif-containing protein